MQALGSWKRYRNVNNPNFEPTPMAVAPEDDEAFNSTRQSTGAGDALDDDSRRGGRVATAGQGQGQRTAPSSLGRQREEGLEDSGEEDLAGDLVI